MNRTDNRATCTADSGAAVARSVTAAGKGGRVAVAIYLSLSAPRGRSDVELQRVGREAILHDRRDGQAHVINGSAARLWELCDGRSFDDLVVAFAEPYEVAPEVVRLDVECLLQSFDGLGLLA